MDKGKLVFFDVDGTIVPGDTHRIPDSTRRALEQARERGHRLVVNTGRPYRHVEGQVRALPFHGYICSLGSLILWEGRQLFHRTLSPDQCARVRDLGRACGMYCLFEGETGVWCDLADTCQLARQEFAWLEKNGVPAFSNTDRPDFQFDKFVTWPGPGADPEKFCRRLSALFQFIPRENHMLEAAPCGLSKAEGMRYLMEHMGVDRQDVYAFGDGPNDLDMLALAGTGILMGNAPQELWPRADYVTARLEDDGLCRAMEHFGLIG